MFNIFPFNQPRRCPHHNAINHGSTPIEEVIRVTEEAERVVFRVPNNDIRCLPGQRGTFVLCCKDFPVINNTDLPVFINDGCHTKPLYYCADVQMTAGEFANGHYYWFFYDKCDDVIILMNAGATPAP